MAKKLNIKLLDEPKILMEPVSQNDKRFIRCRILIVCEGEKTEPNYFRSFSMMKNSSGLVYEVKTAGGGINTIQVVNKAIELKEKAEKERTPYDSVWAVFDRDSFRATNFDNAINKAEEKGIGCAWSNEAFELWYVYHFDDRCTAMNRKEYKDVITNHVRVTGYHNSNKEYTYQKNDSNMRAILSACKCDEEKAISRAEHQSETFDDKRFSIHNPCTMVYKLVKQLIGKDKIFVNHIKSKLEEK